MYLYLKKYFTSYIGHVQGWNQHVKGEGIDTAELAMLLRKKVGYASIVSVAEDKKEERKEEKEDEMKMQYMAGSGTHSHGYNLPPYALLFCEIREPCYDTYACTIL